MRESCGIASIPDALAAEADDLGQVPLAGFTTLGEGGEARIFLDIAEYDRRAAGVGVLGGNSARQRHHGPYKGSNASGPDRRFRADLVQPGDQLIAAGAGLVDRRPLPLGHDLRIGLLVDEQEVGLPLFLEFRHRAGPRYSQRRPVGDLRGQLLVSQRLHVHDEALPREARAGILLLRVKQDHVAGARHGGQPIATLVGLPRIYRHAGRQAHVLDLVPVAPLDGGVREERQRAHRRRAGRRGGDHDRYQPRAPRYLAVDRDQLGRYPARDGKVGGFGERDRVPDGREPDHDQTVSGVWWRSGRSLAAGRGQRPERRELRLQPGVRGDALQRPAPVRAGGQGQRVMGWRIEGRQAPLVPPGGPELARNGGIADAGYLEGPRGDAHLPEPLVAGGRVVAPGQQLPSLDPLIPLAVLLQRVDNVHVYFGDAVSDEDKRPVGQQLAELLHPAQLLMMRRRLRRAASIPAQLAAGQHQQVAEVLALREHAPVRAAIRFRLVRLAPVGQGTGQFIRLRVAKEP